ncbi:MAG: acyl carrier protein [Marinibacterium sp.]
MNTTDRIMALLAKHAEVDTIGRDDKLFGGGINLSSVGYTEFVLAFEDEFDTELDLEGLDVSVETVGEFVDLLETHLG